jgi:pantetheine-phosphate adenylyltransferase
LGHYDILKRGLALFDEIIIGIGRNSTKKDTFPIREREEAIRKIFKDEPRIKVAIYDCLTVDFAQEQQASFILRGIRCVEDFEYERNMAEANKQLANIETVILYTRPEYAHISSTLVRDLYAYGKDVSAFLPNELR